jgi:4-amino-4-deoxy-L-arabinose transferase-like glycosyltransferase
MNFSTLLTFLFALPWLLFLPGFLTQLGFVSRRPLTARRDWLETGFISLLFSLCLTGWLGVLLVELGWFSLSRVLVLIWVYCALAIGLLVRGRRGGKVRDVWRSLWARGDRWTWLLAAVVLVGAAFFFHPHEYVLGGADAGVYVNLGGHISRSGSLVFDDPDLAALDPELYPSLFRQQPSYLIPTYIQFPGFYLAEDQPGRVIPQFYPLHPVWLGIFYGLGGLRASLYVTPLWGVLASLAVGLTATALFGRRVGVLATTLLVISAPQIWFARYPTAEALTQLLLFGGIWAFSRYVVDESPELGLLAGLSLGEVMMVRPDTYFLLAIPFLWVAYLHLRRRLGRRHLVFLVPFLVLSLHSLAHGLLQSWPYLYNTYHFELARLPISLMVVAGGVLVIGFLGLDAWVGGRPERLSRLAGWLKRGATVFAVLVVLAAVYAYFFRPQQADPASTIPYWYGGENIPDVEPYNLVRLGWYVSPLGIALAVLGWWWMLRRELSLKAALFLGIGLFFTFLYVQNSRNNPHHIYVMRRYVPAVIPALTVAAAYAIVRWWRHQEWWHWLALIVAVGQVALLLNTSRTVLRQVDYRGLVDQLTPWAESLDPDAVILFDDDRPISTGTTIGTPLRYLFGHTVFDLQESYLTRDALQELIGVWHAQGRRILVAVGPDGVREPFDDWSLASLPGLRLEAQVLENSYTHVPRQVQPFTLALELFELEPGARTDVGVLRVDIGASDFFYLGEGWYGKERLPNGTTMRWTRDAAQFILPERLDIDGHVQLRFQLATSSQAPRMPVEVRLVYGADVIARWQVGTAFAEYEATLLEPAPPQSPLTLWLETDTWSPQALGISADARDLGVMVDWVKITD